jgi:hypothetical protein
MSASWLVLVGTNWALGRRIVKLGGHLLSTGADLESPLSRCSSNETRRTMETRTQIECVHMLFCITTVVVSHRPPLMR